jgi:hypothetical protein
LTVALAADLPLSLLRGRFLPLASLSSSSSSSSSSSLSSLSLSSSSISSPSSESLSALKSSSSMSLIVRKKESTVSCDGAIAARI